MEKEQIIELAKNLRKPEGEFGLEVASGMNQGNREMNLNALKILNPQSTDKILEIGMGNGAFVSNILEHHEEIHYTGIDYSELMVEESIKMNQKWIDLARADFTHGDIDDLPFDDNSFSAIFTVNTLYFWNDPIKTLEELKRVLRNSGRLLISFRPKENMAKIPVTKYNFNLYSLKEVEELMAKAGFSNIRSNQFQESPLDFDGILIEKESLVVTGIN